MEILALLLEKPGEVVSREEIRQRLWEDDTFVDFEHSLNAAVNKLREILGDDSLRPRFVETVPRRGYRFVGEIEHEPEKEVIPAPAMVTPTPKALPSRRILAVAGALVLVGVSAWMLLRSGHPEAFQIISNRQLTTTPGLATSPTFSPDGRQMAYAMDRGHGNEIFIRQVSPGGVELQLTSDGQQNVDPSWSPNGETVAYHAIKGKGIWLIPGLGGAPRRVTDFGSRPRWSADGQWLAFQSGDTTDLSAVNPGAFPPSTIWVVRQDGTGLRQVTQSGRPEGGHGQPSWSPDSRHIIFTSTFYGAATVDAVDLQTGTTTQIAPTSSFYVDPTYSPDGQYVFFGGTSATNETALWQMKISPKTSRPEGPPKVLLYGRIRHLQVAKDGKKILYTSVQASSSLESLALDKNLSPSGNVKTLRTDVGCRVTVPRISPDGKSIAFNLCWEGAATQVWTMQSDGTASSVLTSDTNTTGVPNWFPDSKHILYITCAPGNPEPTLRVIDTETRQSKVLGTLKHDVAQMSLSPDGKTLAFGVISGGKLGVWLLDMQSQQERRITSPEKSISFPAWSPDGRALAVETRVNQFDQLAILPLDGGPLRQLTFDDGVHFIGSWSKDGQHLIYAAMHNYVWNIYDLDLRTGVERPITNYNVTSGFVRYPQISATGDQIVYEHLSSTGNIWLMELK